MVAGVSRSNLTVYLICTEMYLHVLMAIEQGGGEIASIWRDRRPGLTRGGDLKGEGALAAESVCQG